MKKIEFRDLLLQYYTLLTSFKYRLQQNIDSSREFQKRISVNMAWFHYLIEHLDSKDVFKKTFEKRKLSRKKFLLPEDQRCPGCEDGKPLYILKYRGIDIPVYDDDYGQQEVAYFDGKAISGGCYNFFPEYEFIFYIDRYLEDRYLEGNYDMYKEIISLFPDHNCIIK